MTTGALDAAAIGIVIGGIIDITVLTKGGEMAAAGKEGSGGSKLAFAVRSPDDGIIVWLNPQKAKSS